MSSRTVEAPVERQSRSRPDIRHGHARDDIALFHRTLAELCRSGTPLPRALRITHADCEGTLAEVAERLARDVEAGIPFEDAYRARSSSFPPLYHELVQSGLAAGDLPGVLEEIAAHASFRAAVTAKVRRALAYPLVSAGFVLVAGVLLVLVVPSIGALSENHGLRMLPRQPGWLAAALLGVLALATLGAVAFAWLRHPLDAAGPRRLVLRLPILGRLRVLAAKATFASTLALLARRQLPLPKALQLTAASTDDALVRESVERMATAAASGSNLTESVGTGDLLPASLLWLVQAAEGTGEPAAALADVAAIYERRLEQAVDRLALFVTPVLELLIGLAVLALALSYVLPGFDLLKNVIG